MFIQQMARAGVRALEWYDPQTGKHGQAHMQARVRHPSPCVTLFPVVLHLLIGEV